MFSPYAQVQEVNDEVRAGLREIIDIAIVDGRPAFVFVNNRSKGTRRGPSWPLRTDWRAPLVPGLRFVAMGHGWTTSPGSARPSDFDEST
jgi:hypothetical protein